MRRIVSLMMGVFFLSNSLGNKLAGWTAGFFGSMPLATLFGATAAVCLVAAAIMFVLPIGKISCAPGSDSGCSVNLQAR
jgi:dipeptide/tripeptide permease